MKKNLYRTIIVIVFGFIFANFTKVEAGDLIAVYPSQWNIKVLELRLVPVSDDVLNALTVKNLGLVPDSYLKEVVLYKDDGDDIFQGWKKDEEVGKGIYYSDTGVYYWKDLNIAVPKEGKRFFVVVEIKANDYIAVDRRTIQMSIPGKYDANNNGLFDIGTDMGIFMNSKDNGPVSELISSEIQTIYKKSTDALAPKTVITYPLTSGKISDKNVVIVGASQDQGGSTINSVQINISKAGIENIVWVDVVAIGANYSDWNYNWNNIEDGTYTITTKASDWVGNIGEEAGIMVTVDTIIPTPTPSVSLAPSPTVSPMPTPSPEAQILDGDLIRVKDTLDIYIVKIVPCPSVALCEGGGVKKFKRLILNPAIFNSYGHLKWSDVKDVSRATLDAYATSDLVIEVNSDGSVANPKVFRISSVANSDIGQKRWLNVSAAQFVAAGLDWDSIFNINYTEASLEFYPEGVAITNL